MTELNRIINIDALEGVRSLPDESINCCVTSPPYWGLRDYKVRGQLGQEKTPEEFIDKLVAIFHEINRAMTDDGNLYVNIGDSYAAPGKKRSMEQAIKNSTLNGSLATQCQSLTQQSKIVSGLKPKDMVGIPWMLAFALRADGWYLREDIIWAKRNAMPESVTDRCTRSHEHIFHLTKSPRYYYDQDAIKEPAIYDVDGTGTKARKARQKDDNKTIPTQERAGIRQFKDASKMNGKHSEKQRGHSRRHAGFNDRWDKMSHVEQCTGMRNKRDVWHIAPAQFPEAHFATFPEEIPDLCIRAGCPVDGIVLDPFMGAGTTALVARKRNRNYIGFELNPEYIAIAERRIANELGMFR